MRTSLALDHVCGVHPAQLSMSGPTLGDILDTSMRSRQLSRIDTGSISLIAWLLYSIKCVYDKVVHRASFSEFASKNSCVPDTALPISFLGSIRHKLELLLCSGGDLLDVVFANKFLQYGETHTITSSYGTPVVVHTIDPKNINSILCENEKAWGPAKSRSRTMYPLAQDGLLNSRGDIWHKNRKTILRHIGTKRVKDVRNAEADIQLLSQAMDRSVIKAGLRLWICSICSIACLSTCRQPSCLVQARTHRLQECAMSG
ncbi:hypothetical protein DOTSEDRAFT_70159 [Dothistroma septosporum NZE10]|uniref:Uncharacterized protein n=1 Tax=Dothistroma septosporum (strain NZE10 / CBS 128990) TaxID=675120 RepID=N1PRQ3_DOTSN|nr:hypothetical protein DOTSEDRAFT_70159 [Dothistroma septosporum NZE10]